MGLRYVCGTLRILFGLGLLLTGLENSFAQDLTTLKNAMDLAAAARTNALNAYHSAKETADAVSGDSTALARALSDAQANSSSANTAYENSTRELATKKGTLSRANTARASATTLAAAAANTLRLADSNVAKTLQALALAQSQFATAQTDLATKTKSQETAKSAADAAKAALAKSPRDRTLILQNASAALALTAAERSLASARNAFTSASARLNTAASANSAALLVQSAAKQKSDTEASKLAIANQAASSALSDFETHSATNKSLLSTRNAALIAESQANFRVAKWRSLSARAQLAVSNALGAFGVADIAFLKAKKEYEDEYDHQVATRLVFGSLPSSSVAGSTFTITVTALNAKNGIAQKYKKSVSLTSSDSNAVLPSAFTLINGVATVQVSLRSSGNRTLGLTSESLTGTSSPVSVTPSTFSAATSVFTVSGAVVSGQTTPLTLTLKDAFGNTAPSNAPNPEAILLTTSLVGGTVRFGSITGSSPGVYETTVTGILSGALVINASVSGTALQTSAEVTIQPGAIASLALTDYPLSALPGEAIKAKIQAFDANGNLVTQANDLLTLTGTDPLMMSDNGSLSSGSAELTLTFNTPGSQTFSISVSDVGITSEAIEVKSLKPPLPLALVQVTGGNEVCAGVLIKANSEFGVLTAAHCVSGVPAGSLTVLYADRSSGTPLAVAIHESFDSKTLSGDLAYLAVDGAYGSAILYPAEVRSSPVASTDASIFGWETGITTDGSNHTVLPTEVLSPEEGSKVVSSFDQNVSLVVDHGTQTPLNGGVLLIPDSKTSTGYRFTGIQSFTDGTRSILTDLSSKDNQNWLQTTLSSPGSYSILASVSASNAGDEVSFALEARSLSGKLMEDLQETVSILSTDPKAEVSQSVNLLGGVGSFQTKFYTSGLQNISVVGKTVVTTSDHLLVNPGSASLALATLASGSESVPSGSSTLITLRVFDSYGNSNPKNLPESEDLNFSASGGSASGSFDSPIHAGNGVYSTSFTGTVAGQARISVSHPSLGSISGPLWLTVLPGAPTAINIDSAPVSLTAGASFLIQLSLVDSYNNVVTTASGSPFSILPNSGQNCDSGLVEGGLRGNTSGSFVSGQASLDGIQPISSSIRSFSVQTGTLATCISGVSVAPDVIASLVFTTAPAPTNITLNSAFTTQPVLKGYDSYSNLVTNDTDTIVLLTATSGLNCTGSPISKGLGGITGMAFSEGIAAFSNVSVGSASARSILATAGEASACFSGLSPGTPPVAKNLAAASNFASPVQANTIALSYTDVDGDLATSCSVTNAVNVSVSSACSCSKGECSVGILGASGQLSGSFQYTVTAGGSNSNVATASISIYPATTFAFDPTSRYYGMITVGETGAGFDFKITNSGTTQAVNCTAPALASATNFTIVSDSCGTSSLAAGASCLVKVAPNPGSAATLTTTLTRNCLNVTLASNSSASNGLSVAGKATAPTSTSYGTTPLAFGNVRVGGSSYTREYVFTNAGYGAASCSSPALSNSTDFSIVSDSCGTGALARGASCSVFVKANPASTGAKSANLTRTCGTSTATIALSATGSTGSGVSVTDFGSGAGFSDVNATYRGYTCVVLSNGSVQCWGGNMWGQLGDGTITNSLTPVAVSGISTASFISVGNYHACVVLTDTSVWCWGANTVGQSGRTTLSSTPAGSTPNQVKTSTGNLTNVVALSAGFAHTCAIRSDGTVWCWGLGTSGQLGNTASLSSSTAVQVTGISTAVINDRNAISAGNGHSCVVLSSGGASCWGLNNARQLGNNSTTNSNAPVSVASLGGTAKSVATGVSNSCFLMSNNVIKCIGVQTFGNLGNNVFSATAIGVPTQVTGITTATAVYGASNGHTFCAVLSDRSAVCWGRNSYGVLGNGNTTNQALPVSISGLSGVSKLSLGDIFSCATTSVNPFRCWGNNSTGENGLGALPYIMVPTQGSILASLGAISFLTSGSDFSCATLTNGTARCWGNSSATYPQLGDGTSISQMLNPVTVSNISTATALAIGEGTSCVLLQDKTVRCWGVGGVYYALGNGSTANALTPVAVTGISTAVEIGLGRSFGCARLAAGTVRCWGLGSSGQQGNGSTAVQTTPASDVLNVSDAIQIAVGYDHACALLSTGAIRCWGGNANGQIGDGTIVAKSTPVAVSGITNAIAISAGTGFSCAVLSDNTVRCWGANTNGLLGDNTNLTRTTPVTVTTLEGSETLTRITSIRSSQDTTCGLRSTGTGNQVVCWGANSFGGSGLGNTNTTAYRRAVEVPGLSNISTLSGGPMGKTMCAITSSGVAKCFGDNTLNMVGDNGFAMRTPSGF